MFRKLYILLVMLCLSLRSGAQVNAVIDSIVKEEMKKQQIIGLSLGIVKGGKVTLMRGYGYADVKDSLPVTENTVFRLGSLSKQFIATAVMALAEEGKLHLTDNIHKYFPDAPAAWDSITIRNLLNHTSGLERESPALSMAKIKPDSIVIRGAYKDTLLFKTGSKWMYSNLGYFVLADIIRQVTGQSFQDYMNALFVKWGLVHTVTTNKTRQEGRSVGYKYNEASDTQTELPDIQVLRPSGAFSSNMADMLLWDSIQRANMILTPEDWAIMWEDKVLTGASAADGVPVYYGYGWFVKMQNGHKVVQHGGNAGGGGFTTTFWKFIDDNMSIVILANATEVPLDKIAYKISVALDPTCKIKKQAVDHVERYPGIYANKELKMKITVTNDDGVLMAQATGQSAFPLKSVGEDIFKFDAAGIEMDFNPAQKSFILKQGGEKYIFIKE